jgi:CRP-like cAMP-binding protein
MLLYQGEVPPHIFLVESGLVRSLNIQPSGEEKTIALYGKNDFFAIEFAFGLSPVSLFYYEAMSDLVVQLVALEEFNKATQSGNDEPFTLQRIARQFVAANMQLNAVGYVSAHDRVVQTMQYLLTRFGERLSGGVYTRIAIPLTQLDISRIAGLTRETTAIELGKLKKKNVLQVSQKHYTVHNKSLLALLQTEELNEVDLTSAKP